MKEKREITFIESLIVVIGMYVIVLTPLILILDAIFKP